MNRILRTIGGSIFVLAAVCLLGSTDASAQRVKKKKATFKTPPIVVTTRIPSVIYDAKGDTGRSISVNKLRIAMDYDMDGKADYVVFNHATNNWQIIKSGGGTINTPFGLRGNDYFTPGDFDGDGKGDLAVFRDSEHKWYVMQSSNGMTVTTDFGATGDEPVARDYDGDNKTDLAVIHKETTGVLTWTIKSSLTGTTSSTAWGTTADVTAPGDYDGDGKFDLAVKRAGRPAATGTAIFIIKKSSDGNQLNIDWGLGSDLAIPGDYDGDGKCDAAVLREGKKQTDPLMWIIKRSSDGMAVVLNFGTTGVDYNAQNDYDGDQATDIAVWNNATATFTVLRSSTMTTTTVALGSPNDYPVASYDTH